MMREPWNVLMAILLLAIPAAARSLLVYAGAAAKPPLEEIARAYEEECGVRVDLVLGGSGHVLAQMRLTGRGDLYLPGSSDYMELAKRQGLVRPETERPVVYLVPAINVRKGNPRGIRTLHDLTRPGLRVAIANPEGVCLGAYAVEIVTGQLDAAGQAAFRRNLVNYTESCEKTATAISLGMVDAVLGWSVFQHWDSTRIESLPLDPGQVARVGTIPIALSTCTRDAAAAQRFLDFVTGPAGREIFARHRYFATPEAAFRWLGAVRPVGGEFAVPADWLAP
ncbi:MAG: substrate-binding domain-containing protein [bacterium]|nr:substrate-binding domain-containing protein [bacterium]